MQRQPSFYDNPASIHAHNPASIHAHKQAKTGISCECTASSDLQPFVMSHTVLWPLRLALRCQWRSSQSCTLVLFVELASMPRWLMTSALSSEAEATQNSSMSPVSLCQWHSLSAGATAGSNLCWLTSARSGYTSESTYSLNPHGKRLRASRQLDGGDKAAGVDTNSLAKMQRRPSDPCTGQLRYSCAEPLSFVHLWLVQRRRCPIAQ